MRGGYRQNAGRKLGSAAKNAEEARRVLSEMVMREIEPIGEALIDRAKRGEVPAIRELFDRAFGKAPQSLYADFAGACSEPIKIVIQKASDAVEEGDMTMPYEIAAKNAILPAN